ncbi:MAG: DUF2279 domain-containing protein [Candidatus Kapaibacteriales bacterium]
MNQSAQSDDKVWLGDKRWTVTGYEIADTTKIRPVPAAITGSVLAGIFIVQHRIQAETIWKDESEFTFVEDGNYALYADKAGHFFGTYFSSYILSESLLASGFSYDASMVLGGALGVGYTLYVEILDGFGANFGFSKSDMISNAAGGGFYILQHYVPFLQNFQPKFSYFPSEWHGDRRRQPHDAFIDDYSSHVMWLSADVHSMLPESAQAYWPEWLGLSFGYASRNLCDGGNPAYDCESYSTFSQFSDQYGSPIFGERRLILALDYDLQRIIPESRYDWVNWLVQSANFIKLPAPSIEYSIEEDRFRYYLAFPFVIGG